MTASRFPVFASILVATTLSIAACGSTTENVASTERQAGLVYTELRLCIQNLTSTSIKEEVRRVNDGVLATDQGAKEKGFKSVITPMAFVCYTTDSDFAIPGIKFVLNAGSGWSDLVEVTNQAGSFWVRVDPDNSPESLAIGAFDKKNIDARKGESFSFTLEDLPGTTIVGFIDGKEREYPNGLKAYQMDLRVIPE